MIGILTLLADPPAVRLFWGRWDRRQLALLIPAMLVGAAIGTWALTLLSERWRRKAIGMTALGVALLPLVAMVASRRGSAIA
jgi:hypothetical protein